MKLEFVKHHGFGNDFLIGFDVDLPAEQLPALARQACDRHRGVGADGLIVSADEHDDEATMVLFNADGSRPEISGNGVRCFAHAVAIRHGRALPASLSIGTDAGLRTVELAATQEPTTVVATAAMGDVIDIDAPAGWDALGVDPVRPTAHLGVGNPHTVVAVEDLDSVDLAALGASLPDVNLEIVVAGPDAGSITMRVHERGAGITEACGTGACAAAVAAIRWGLAKPVDGKLVVEMEGGRASVELDGDRPTAVSLSGPVTYIATIEYPI